MKIHTIHNGCEVNLADSEQSKLRLLEENNITVTDNQNADCIIFHTCTFTQFKEEETIKTIQNLLNTTDKKIIVSGCFLKEYIKNDRIHYIKNEALKNTNWANIVQNDVAVLPKSKLALLPFVTISRGCYGNCTFCSIKLAQGANKSRDINDILIDIEARQDLAYIKLVGDEVAGFGKEKGQSLKFLIDAIIKKFPNIKIKLGSLNCKLLNKYTDEELRIFSYPNIISNIHIPIQSASNRVLKLMSRGYTIEEYLTIYNKLKSNGVVNISGDLICGFPTETVEDHQMNMEFIVKHKFEFLEVFAYTEREGTKAATFEQIPYIEREKRAIQLIVKFMKSYCLWHNISISKLTENKSFKIFNTNIKIKTK